MDSDDCLIDSALEEMHTHAENFQADVIYCERYFMSEGTGEDFKNNKHIATTRIQFGGFVSKPEIVSNNLSVRILDWLNNRFWMSPVLRFSLRNFLIDNNIKFPSTVQEDNEWAFEVLCCAKKIVRVPNICYVRRMHDNSRSNPGNSLNKYLHNVVGKTIEGLKILEKFMSNIDFFKKNPNYKYAVLNKWASNDLQRVFLACLKFPPHVIYEVFLREFKGYLGENDVLISYLFTNNLMLMKNLMITKQKLDSLTKQKINSLTSPNTKK